MQFDIKHDSIRESVSFSKFQFTQFLHWFWNVFKALSTHLFVETDDELFSTKLH